MNKLLSKELRQLVSYAKRSKIRKMKIGEIEFEFTDKAFLNEKKIMKLFEDKAATSESAADYKRDLMWSS